MTTYKLKIWLDPSIIDDEIQSKYKESIESFPTQGKDLSSEKLK